MGDEEKDKVTTHAPKILLAAILDEQRTDMKTVSQTEGELVGLDMEQEVGEEREMSASADGGEGVSFRDSLDAPDLQSFENGAKEEEDERQGDEPDNLVLSGTSDKSPDYGKSVAVKSSHKRTSAKRDVVFINKNKKTARQPISPRTYAAMHRAKVKEKQWKENIKRLEISKEREERQWTQNPGLADSFESARTASINGCEAYNSTNSDLLNNRTKHWYENDLQSIRHRSGNLGKAMHHPYQTKNSDFNANGYRNHVQQPQPYEQHNRTGYDRTYNTAVHYPGLQSHLPTIQHTFASQSAPSGMYSHLRRPLVDQVGCLPEEENCLSSTLPNSEFLEPDLGMRVPDSRLRRKFASEPCLPHSDSPHLERDAKTEKTGYGAINSRQTVTYKPYTLRDYRRVREVESTLFGGLGPNIETTEYKERIQKVSKQKEYAEMLRAQHAGSKKQRQKHIQAPAPQVKQGEAKRQVALNYARSVPKPKKINRREKPSAVNQQEGNRPMHDLTLTEILRMRHEREKNEVDAIRRALASKIKL